MNDLTRFDGQSPFDQIKLKRMDGSEFWSARELMSSIAYDKWERFAGALDRAHVEDHPGWSCRYCARARQVGHHGR